MAKNRYVVRPCDNLGSVADAKRDRQWDVIDTHNDQTVSNHDTRKEARSIAHTLNLARAIATSMVIAFVFAGCFGDDVHTRPDASPKYDACDPTISKDCPITITDARNCQPTRLDAGSGQMCTEPCEQLGCTRDQYEPSCTKGGTVCECNGTQCVGTP